MMTATSSYETFAERFSGVCTKLFEYEGNRTPAVKLKGIQLCGTYMCPGSTVAGFVKGLCGLEQRHLCQPDVTVQKIEPCLVSTLHFSPLLEEIFLSALMNWGCKSLNTQNP